MLKGIYTAFDLKFPLFDILVALACVGIGVFVIVGSLNPLSRWGLIVGSAFVLLSLWFAPTVYRDAARYLRFRRIMRRAELDEDD